MKRIFVIFALAGFLAACNNSADSTAEKKDSLDSITNAKKDMVDSSADQRKDALDSVNQQKKDALDRADSIKHSDSTNKKGK